MRWRMGMEMGIVRGEDLIFFVCELCKITL